MKNEIEKNIDDNDKQLVIVDDNNLTAVVPVVEDNDNGSDNEMDSGFNSRYFIFLVISLNIETIILNIVD